MFILANSDPRTYISKEIIQSGDKLLYTEQEKARHLAKALSKPTDKISSIGNFLPSGRFVEDYLVHRTWKWSTALQAVGFTLNTEHCPGQFERQSTRLNSLAQIYTQYCFTQRCCGGTLLMRRQNQERSSSSLFGAIW